MPEDRRLAAIMFTDIVGYTRLMDTDEDRAFALLKKNRELQRPLIEKYNGRWLKEMGAGILAGFDTAAAAVRCAGEIQNKVRKESIGLRIGIHQGEVVFEGNDVLGDGVNVASRLEEIAEPGCINVSGAIYKDVKNITGISVEFHGEKTLKNVDDPIKIYKVSCEESFDETTQSPGSSRPKGSFSSLKYIIVSGIILLIIATVLFWKFC